MSCPIARTVGALALAAALATSSTAVLAATTPGDPAFYLTKKRTNTLGVLSPELRTSAGPKARSLPDAKLRGGGGTAQSGASDQELDIWCENDWFIAWDEDANGNPVVGSYNLHCAGTVVEIG